MPDSDYGTDHHLARKFRQALVMLATARETADVALLSPQHRDVMAQTLELLAAELRAHENSVPVLDGEVTN